MHWIMDWLLVGLAFTGWLSAIDAIGGGGLEDGFWRDRGMIGCLIFCVALGPIWAVGIFVVWIFADDARANPGKML